MKNIMIIAMEEAALIKDGKMTEDEELHTFQGWKSRGYSVKKGETAIAKFPIWKSVTTKDKEEIMIMKNSCWFSTRQVMKCS